VEVSRLPKMQMQKCKCNSILSLAHSICASGPTAHGVSPSASASGISGGVRSECAQLRKAGARQREAGSREFSTENYL